MDAGDARAAADRERAGELPLQDARAGRGDVACCSPRRPLLEGVGGRYFEDCNEAEVVEATTPRPRTACAAYALDPDAAERLWDVSLSMLAERTALSGALR